MSEILKSTQFHIVELHQAQVCVQIVISQIPQFESTSLQSQYKVGQVFEATIATLPPKLLFT
ncbi:hypothetical protein HOF65_01770 [bacterium]|jgi:hypothetical protein|nr:hypothetical protein [bacterium]